MYMYIRPKNEVVLFPQPIPNILLSPHPQPQIKSAIFKLKCLKALSSDNIMPSLQPLCA